GLAGNFRDQLHRRGAGAYHGDALARQVEAVRPAGGMDDLALETLQPGNIRHFRRDQSATGGDDVARTKLPTVVKLDHPEVVGVVEAGTGDFHAKTNQRIDTVLARHPARVVVQLVARREYPRPVGVLLERKRIGKRGDVDGDTRIAVIAPGAADILAAFENQDVVDTIGAQLDGNTDTGNAGANDDDLVVRDDGLCACRSGKGGHVHAGA